jgi:predicted transcriptional regulator
MTRVGKALRQVLETYGINQNRLAIEMGLSKSVVNSWATERRTPSSETVIEIRDALKSIDPQAAEEFIRLYLEG